jgi:plasmid stabilization system protein ParE
MTIFSRTGLGIDPELAASFEATFFDYLESIIANPLLYNLRRPPTRRVNLTPRFGEYYIAYMLWNQRVVILAIGHAKRRPYYWRKRITEAGKLF